MKIKITTKATIKAKPRTLIHGEPGVGKSTFAAAAPGVVFICAEQGTNNIAVQRARIEDVGAERDPQTFDEVCLVLDSLIEGLRASPTPLFENLAIDTMDAMEAMVHGHVCKTGNKRSIADFGFGKGYDNALDSFRFLLKKLEEIQAHDVGIILLTHTKTEHFNNPEGQDFDYYDIKLHKKVAGLLVEWSDNILFARREQYALEEGGKIRGVGSGARFLHTQKQPAYVAKNRFELPEKLPLRWHDYQDAMDRGQAGNFDELRAHASDLIKQMDPSIQGAANTALHGIGDPKQMAHFVDYCRSKLNITEATK